MSTTLLNSALFWLNYILIFASAVMTGAILLTVRDNYAEWKKKRQSEKQSTASESTD